MDHQLTHDSPKSLSQPDVRAARLDQLQQPHILPLTRFVEQMRQETRRGLDIPYFDPMDGGINAKCLFLGEAPGPEAVKSGFVSRNNPDNSARNFFELSREAAIAREQTVAWNIVPWYIGSGKKIRPALRKDIREGEVFLLRLLLLFPNLSVVVLAGKKAQVIEGLIQKHLPGVKLITMMNTSPLVLNTKRENRGKILAKLKQVAQILSA